MLKRITILGYLLAASAASLTAQSPPEQPPSAQLLNEATPAHAPESIPTIHVTTRLVVLDVVVSDGQGHPGAGLKASDFKLTEDGVPQSIDSFAEHDVSPPAESAEDDTVPRNTFTVQPPVKSDGAMTVIVVAASSWSDFIHGQLKDYFRTAPNTPTAIFRSDGIGMHLIQGFTSDHKLLVEAAESKRIWVPLGPRFHSDPASFRIRAAGPRTQRLAAYLAGIPGRINIIWLGGVAPTGEISRDFPDDSSALADVTNMVGRLNRTTDVRRISRVALYSVTIGRCANGKREMAGSNGGRSFHCTFPKQAMEQIAATDSHYYTISYRPTNPNWNGAYRRIHLDVIGYAQPPFTIRWSQLITGWAEDIEPTVMYRNGYFADSAPAFDAPRAQVAAAVQNDSANGGANATPSPRHKLVSISSRGDLGPNAAQIEAATAFGSPTPTQMHFTITITPAAEQEKTKLRDELPADNLLTTPFRDGSYRNYSIHYWVDPQDLHLVQTSSGRYQDNLRIIAVVYRDDGVTANTYATTTHLDVSAADAGAIRASGFTLDQSLAVPTNENFFLRTTVAEQSTGNIGAIEIPVEWIKLPPTQTNQAKNR